MHRIGYLRDKPTAPVYRIARRCRRRSNRPAKVVTAPDAVGLHVYRREGGLAQDRWLDRVQGGAARHWWPRREDGSTLRAGVHGETSIQLRRKDRRGWEQAASDCSSMKAGRDPRM